MTRHIFALIALLLLALPLRARQVLAQFDLNHYEGWTYNKPGFVLNTENISNINKGVKLYRTAGGTDYTLISPTLALTDVQSVQVEVGWNTPTCFGEGYSLEKSSPTVELIDASGAAVAQVTSLLTTVEQEHKVTVQLSVPKNNNGLRLRLAAWKGDVNKPGQVASVLATASSGALLGDLNADGVVNVTDVTALVDLVLANDTTKLTVADINADGVLNVGDVTSLVNLILR